MAKMKKKVNKVEVDMKLMKEGKLHSGSKKGPKVTNPKQAIAIGLSQERKLKGEKDKPKAEKPMKKDDKKSDKMKKEKMKKKKC